ncbi:MAG: zinc ribbon domain-containing protein [Planctomycetota bacterium]|jgi:hypothetical protein
MYRKSSPLSYPLRLPGEMQSPAADLLAFTLPHMQRIIDELWPGLDEIGQIAGEHIWKHLAGWLPRPDGLPSRLWRCILEGAGRTLRAQADRKRVFELLLPLLRDEYFGDDNDNLTKLAYRLRDELGDDREKIGYLLNLIEQIANFYATNERLPTDYYQLQPKPALKRPQLPLAADDGPARGQVYRLEAVNGQLTLRFKYPDGRWRFTPDATFTLPAAVDPTAPLAPTLRLKETKGGETVAVLDFIVEDQAPQGQPTGHNILAFDWGVRRLLSFVILSREGEQLTPPIFVNIGGLAGKQARLRRQISHLKAKKAKLKKKERARVQAEIEACWRKYSATNEALAHFAANLLLVFALLFNCDQIAGEWLKTLKARKKKNNHFRKLRTINWKVNTTIREMIWQKLGYKAKRFALRTRKLWPRGTSHECPRCGQPGVTCKSPEHRHKVSPYGHWFFCKNPDCGYNADRDYVASLNIGRRALIKNYPSAQKDDVKCQPVSYIGSGAVLPFPSPDALPDIFVRCASVHGGVVCPGLLRRLGTTLTGFNRAITVGPMWLPGYG